MIARLIAVLLLALVALTACSRDEQTLVNAVFEDAGDLTSGHAVKIADVTVGKVDGVELTDDYRALVKMSVDPTLQLPADMEARLRKTNLLGERFVELVPSESGRGEFKSGSTITQTTVVPELEEVVSSGTDVVAAIAADTLAGAIESGAEGMDGRGETLGGVLTDLNTLVDTYDDNSDDLVRLINGFDAFLADVAPEADMHGRAIDELEQFTAVVRAEDEQLIDTLVKVQDLAVTGTDIITTHRTRFDNFFTRFDRLTGEIVEHDQDLDDLFENAYAHNYNTIRGVNRELAQVFFDFIVCGVNDDPGDPVRDCTKPPGALPKPQPRPPQDYGQSSSGGSEPSNSGGSEPSNSGGSEQGSGGGGS